jgi:hypothetical protein
MTTFEWACAAIAAMSTAAGAYFFSRTVSEELEGDAGRSWSTRIVSQYGSKVGTYTKLNVHPTDAELSIEQIVFLTEFDIAGNFEIGQFELRYIAGHLFAPQGTTDITVCTKGAFRIVAEHPC